MTNKKRGKQPTERRSRPMQTFAADAAIQNQEYQAEFARNLIDTLGLDEAVDICARN